MSCPRLLFPPNEPWASGDPGFPPTPMSRLIESPTDTQVRTSNQTTDSRTAVKRGLAEYLSQLVLDLRGGRQVRFKRVYDAWPENEDRIEFPAGIVHTTGAGIYADTRLTPGVSKDDGVGNDEYLSQSSEYDITLNLEVWARDNEQRVGMAMLVEQALTAVDYQFGVTIELPHYFNTRAKYDLVSSSFPDDEISAFHNHRRIIFAIGARVPLIRAVSFPLAFPRLGGDGEVGITVLDGTEDC